MIGTPQTVEDTSFIKEEKYIDYIKGFDKRDKMDLQEKYPGTEPRGIKLLERMLEFNPDKRITAEEALKDEYFDDVRILEQEEFEVCQVDLKFDEEEFSEEEMRKLVIEEI